MSKISSKHYYDCHLDTIFRFFDPKNITLDTRIIKISHVDQKIWKKIKTFIFGGGHFEKIQYGRHQELIAPGTPSKIDHYDLPSPQKKFGAFVRRVNILTLRPLAITNYDVAMKWQVQAITSKEHD